MRNLMSAMKCGAALVLVGSLTLGSASCDRARGPASAAAATFRPPQPPPSNLVSWCVLQRDEHDEGTVVHTESCDANGEVFARVLRDGQPLPGLDWHKVGSAADGKCAASIEHIPVGGPYRVELEIRGEAGRPPITRSADNILVGDIWALPGQSNMLGWGDLVDAEQPSPWVHSYGLNERWSIAEEPLHWPDESPDPAHHPGCTAQEIAAARAAPRAVRTRGAGLGLPFAKALYRRTGVPMGLVPCAQGGTSMDQWSPARKNLGGASLYGSLQRRIQAVGGRIKGVLWYQGEDDAHSNTVKTYRAKLVNFIEALRDGADDPQLPFYYVQIGRTTGYPHTDEAWSSIREDERLAADELPGVFAVASIDLELDDHIHIGTRGLKRLGRRLALVACHELYGDASLETGPHLRGVEFANSAGTLIRVRFDDVNGRLKPDVHIGGFSLRTADDKPGPEFFDVRVDRDDPQSVLCRLESAPPSGCTLWYGYGRNPYCDLVDEQDMAVLVFGPIPLPPRR